MAELKSLVEEDVMLQNLNSKKIKVKDFVVNFIDLFSYIRFKC